jgi:hypothetical protein
MPKRLVRHIQERVDVLCRKHPLGFRFVTSGVLFAGGITTEVLASAKGLERLFALIPFALAGSAALVRESTGYRHAMGKTRGARKEVVYKMLEFTALSLQAQAAARQAPPGAKLIRANVMIPSADGGTLKVWVHYNMTGDPDCELEIDAHTGFAGYCMRFADGPVAFDRSRNPDDPRCRLHPPQAQAAVRTEMKAMLAVPIFDPYVSDALGGQRQKIGLLIVDSDLSLDTIGLDQELPQNLMARVADLLSHAVAQD